ncbi:MAG: biopolymer transporter ExbD [Planctomycetales bacterium]
MPLRTESIEEPNLNLTPMIDIVFLLIIFFMVGARFTELERQYGVQLPTVSDAAPLTSLPDPIYVNIRNDGSLQVEDRDLNVPQLDLLLRAARQRYAEQVVVVRGDGGAPYQAVMDVLASCSRAGLKNVNMAYRLRVGERP